jgi:hypothetical protein
MSILMLSLLCEMFMNVYNLLTIFCIIYVFIYIRGSVLAHLFFWFVFPTCIVRLITLWYLSHFTTLWLLGAPCNLVSYKILFHLIYGSSISSRSSITLVGQSLQWTVLLSEASLSDHTFVPRCSVASARISSLASGSLYTPGAGVELSGQPLHWNSRGMNKAKRVCSYDCI